MLTEHPVLPPRRRLLRRFAPPWRRTGADACEDVRTALPEIMGGDARAPGGLVDHVEYCLGCQAEVARYRRLLRLLHQLRTLDVAIPASLVTDVLSALEEAANRRAVRSVLTGRRIAYGSAVVGAGAVAATLLVLRRGPAPVRKPSAATST